MIACDDAGTLINPLIAEGQVHGGSGRRDREALFEEVRYDSEGNPQHANLVTYCIPSAIELPPFELVVMETPTPYNPLGAKGIASRARSTPRRPCGTPVIDALAHLGVRHMGCPATASTSGARDRPR